jgi:hypothetical protein
VTTTAPGRAPTLSVSAVKRRHRFDDCDAMRRGPHGWERSAAVRYGSDSEHAQWQRLRANSASVPSAFDSTTRPDPSVPAFFRTAACDRQ